MDTRTLKRQFETIGARLTINEAGTTPRRAGFTDFTLDISQDRHGEFFSLLVRPETAKVLDLRATDLQPRQRHLLLLATRLDGQAGIDEKRKFLCGHDERHWFVAALPGAGGVSRVTEAMEALKPAAVQVAQQRSGVRRKDWNRRWNTGFIRQGEWFFLPRPDLVVATPDLILHDEPIRRAGGKPHLVENLYRTGGTTVYVHRRYPNGLTQAEHERLLAARPEAAGWPWRVMRRNPLAFAQGKVRHPDHATICLPFWHQVLMSEEQRAANVAFLD